MQEQKVHLVLCTRQGIQPIVDLLVNSSLHALQRPQSLQSVVRPA